MGLSIALCWAVQLHQGFRRVTQSLAQERVTSGCSELSAARVPPTQQAQHADVAAPCTEPVPLFLTFQQHRIALGLSRKPQDLFDPLEYCKKFKEYGAACIHPACEVWAEGLSHPSAIPWYFLMCSGSSQKSRIRFPYTLCVSQTSWTPQGSPDTNESNLFHRSSSGLH